jgi:hypothetical protein
MLRYEGNIFSKHVHRDFSCLIGLDVQLLNTKPHDGEANRPTGATLHGVRNSFFR